MSAPASRDARQLAGLSLTALGVVYGDIGTSPLYAFRECFKPETGLAPTAGNVHGVLSLIVWALVLIVSVKYLALVLRLDNRGEGGIMALLALVMRLRRRFFHIALGLFGAALLYGDGVITPAISVLSAAEGLQVVAPAFAPFVLPSTLLILFLLFAFQRYGSARIGSVFGPIMLVWFATIGVLGAVHVARGPGVLAAVNPWHGLRFLAEHGAASVLVLGGVVLAVTGAEALYADLGHFGPQPIRLAWFGLVLPALVLNYLGQGALVLAAPDAIGSPFYLLAPAWLRGPLVGLATAATVVASQALITGVFSLAKQSVLLRYLPRLSFVHTSRSASGQIYVPAVNSALMVGCLLLVVSFGSSTALASAYGVAVTGTMAITTALFAVIARHRWHWAAWRVAAVAGGFLVIELAFFGANLVKIEHGGWVPLAIGGVLFFVMTTWHRGVQLVGGTLARMAEPLEKFIGAIQIAPPPRVPGTAVFLTPNVGGAPPSLVHHLRHNKVLHEEILLMSILTEEVPEVPEAERVTSEPAGEGFWRVRGRHGFMERPDVPRMVEMCCGHGMRADPAETTYYLGRARLLPEGPAPMMRWRKRVFAFMAWNASSATDFFGLPPDRVIEIGARLKF